MDENETYASLWEHIEDLRKTFLQILIIIGISVLICFLCHEPIIAFLKKPLQSTKLSPYTEEKLTYRRVQNQELNAQIVTLPENILISQDLSKLVTPLSKNNYQIDPGGSLVYAKNDTSTLVLLGPLEGILISIKTSLWAGSFISSPLWLFVLLQFFSPGLRKRERQLILPFIITSIGFILLGCLFALKVTIPIANQYLLNFNQSIGINFWSLGNYLDYTLFLLFANGIAFELGALGIFAVHLRIVTVENLIARRRFAIVAAFILAAILTPPDVLTQFMLAIPLISLYEGLILYARMQRRLLTKKISQDLGT